MNTWMVITLAGGVLATVLLVSWWWAREQHNRQVELLKIRRLEMDASWRLHQQTVDAFSQMLRSSRAERINAEQSRQSTRRSS